MSRWQEEATATPGKTAVPRGRHWRETKQQQSLRRGRVACHGRSGYRKRNQEKVEIGGKTGKGTFRHLSQKKAAKQSQDRGRRVSAGKGPASSFSTYRLEGCKSTHSMQGEPSGVNSKEEKKVRCVVFVTQLLLRIWWTKNCLNLSGGKNDH